MAICTNPYKRGYEAHEQRIFKMFWNPSDADSIQEHLCSKNPCAQKIHGLKFFWKLIGMAMNLGK
eukprot:11620050-Karenia_brevis.AAC.1